MNQSGTYIAKLQKRLQEELSKLDVLYNLSKIDEIKNTPRRNVTTEEI